MLYGIMLSLVTRDQSHIQILHFRKIFYYYVWSIKDILLRKSYKSTNKKSAVLNDSEMI